MRAVNLIPVDARRGGGAPGRSGAAVYVLLGGLAVAIVALAAYVLVQNTVSSRQADLAKVKRDADTAQATATALRPYREFAQLSQTRVQTVGSLAKSRFDWERAMRDLALVLPDNVWLTSFVGTVAPGVNFGDAGATSGDTGTLRSSQQVPAVELVGCTDSQAEVARVMSRLRLVQGVTQVSLASSEKAEASSSGAASGSGSGSGGGGSNDCRNGSSKFPQFSMVVFFSPLPGAATGAPSTGAPSTGAAPSNGAKASSGNGGTATAANNSGASGAASGGTGK